MSGTWAGVSSFLPVAVVAAVIGLGTAPAGALDPGPSSSPPTAAATPASAPATATPAAAPKPAAARPRGKWPTVKCNVPNSGNKPYYVEFRARTAVSFGHTFVIFGRVNGNGGAATWEVAGLHPAGDDPNTYATGLVVPVPAETGMSDGDLDEIYVSARWCVRLTDEIYVSARWCVRLTEADYRKMVAAIRDLQKRSTTWHGPSTNCNTFVGDIARSIGLDAPSTGLIYPEVFVNSIKSMNTGGSQLPNIPVVQWGVQQGPNNERERANDR